MLVLTDKSYVVEENGIQTLYGEAYVFENGKITKICENNKKLDITNMFSEDKNIIK